MELKPPRVWTRICELCGLEDGDPLTVERGVCASCEGREEGDKSMNDGSMYEFLMNPAFTDRIVCEFRNGMWCSNVPRMVKHHSLNGFSWGYPGSGPADLALNICETALLALGYAGRRVDCWEGTCFAAAWAMHQEFKARFIAPMTYEGGEIPFADVRAWIVAWWEKNRGVGGENFAHPDGRPDGAETVGAGAVIATHPDSDAWDEWRTEVNA